jgi:hypothetical protein
MTNISINDKNYQIPQSWDDTNEDVAIRLLTLMYSEPKTTLLQIKIIRLLLPISDSLFKKLDDEQVLRLTRTTQWVWDLPKKAKLPFLCFSHKNYKFWCPQNNFETGSYAEFVAANIAFAKYSNPTTPDYEAAYELVAILCRKATLVSSKDPKWNGDIRQEFNSEICRQSAKSMHDLPAGIVIAVINYWVNFLEDISNQYPIFEKGDGKSDGGLGWVNTMFSIAEDGTFGAVKDVEKEFFHKVCLYLVKKKADYDEAKRQHEENAKV